MKTIFLKATGPGNSSCEMLIVEGIVLDNHHIQDDSIGCLRLQTEWIGDEQTLYLSISFSNINYVR